jgi:amino acid adenylation domain-containing protein
VRAGAVVAVCLPPGADLIVSLLGVLSAGAAYLPLDPGHPEARRTLMAEDSGARVAIAEAPFGSLLTVPPRSEDSAAPTTVPALAGTPDDLAYLIYTSGSTGTPKAVQVPHRALLHRLLIPGFLGLGPDTVFLQAAPAIFDMSALEIWGALLHGGAVRVPPAGRDARALGRFVAGSDITHVAMVPALAESVLDEAPAAFGDVERVMVGGEVVSPELIRRLKAGGTRSVATIYGPTEATIIASTWQADDSADAGSTVPLGRPLPGTRLVVLGRHGQVVPRGATGEICIGGPGVSDGYRGRPGLTEQRFVPDPERPGGRLYRSGDLGRWNADGDLEFAGRIDEQVKVRGFRIEPGEVQAALTALPEVSGALVMADAGAGGTARLIAYVTAAPGTAPRGSDLKRRLAERLPEYMVPSVITVLDEFPLADTGKIDRSRLPRPRPEAATGFVAPRNPAERAAAVIAADLLGAERVGVFDNFFELGGDSLLATRFAASLRKALRRDIGLADVLTTPTVAELAALPRQAAAGPITPRPRAGRRSR